MNNVTTKKPAPEMASHVGQWFECSGTYYKLSGIDLPANPANVPIIGAKNPNSPLDHTRFKVKKQKEQPLGQRLEQSLADLLCDGQWKK